jgi:TRAP-type C4-dicarboxylate transport system permease small subunit
MAPSKFFLLIDKVIEWFIILGLALLVIVCMTSVIFRYFIGSSIFWSDEFMRYLFVNVTFYGCPLLVYKKSHILVDITDMFFSPALRQKIIIMNDFLFVILGSYMAFASTPLVAMNMGNVSSAMGVQMSWIYLCIPVGFAMVAVNGLRLLSEDMKPAAAIRNGDGS